MSFLTQDTEVHADIGPRVVYIGLDRETENEHVEPRITGVRRLARKLVDPFHRRPSYSGDTEYWGLHLTLGGYSGRVGYGLITPVPYPRETNLRSSAP